MRVASRQPASPAVDFRLLGLGCALLAFICGCRVLSPGPVPQDVADCRKLSQRAIGALHKGDLPTAETLARRAVETNPADVQARQTYSESLWRAGQREAALDESLAAWKLAGDDPLVATRLGEQFLDLGKPTEAARLAAEAIDLCPECGAAWALRARARAALGNLNESLSDYQRALRSLPNDRGLLLELAGIYRQLNRPTRALALLGQLRETYPQGEEPPQLDLLMAEAYAGAGRHEDEVRALSNLAVRVPDRKNWELLANAQRRAGQPAAAEISWAEAQRIDASPAGPVPTGGEWIPELAGRTLPPGVR